MIYLSGCVSYLSHSHAHASAHTTFCLVCMSLLMFLFAYWSLCLELLFLSVLVVRQGTFCGTPVYLAPETETFTLTSMFTQTSRNNEANISPQELLLHRQRGSGYGSTIYWWARGLGSYDLPKGCTVTKTTIKTNTNYTQR